MVASPVDRPRDHADMRSKSEGDTVDVEDRRLVQGGVEDGGRDGSDGAMDDDSHCKLQTNSSTPRVS